ncbi:TRAP transporter large permease [Marinomonas mediterranea]|uniref:TRAP transporter large permease n=1 Tax=Marinomonas mediterranea TaxID=119864 RepID=UPI00234B89E7|nr:TRAP transporter large permease subunit [Marinomonas mediterranea]WCN08603.1 TRAP transporter large permease subunit [Marinomonas mediterranea]
MSVALVILLFSAFLIFLFTGFPVAFVLGGVGVLFAVLGSVLADVWGYYDVAEIRSIGFVANRIFSTISNYSLIPMSMFIFMGYLLDRSGVAERLIAAMHKVLGRTPGGLSIAVVFIGVILAASTGIIGASVVLLSTIALPSMLNAGYARWLSAGTVGATGCLGILIPPSIMLVVMGDQLRLPVGDLFTGAILPGLLLALCFVSFIFIVALIRPETMPATKDSAERFDRRALWDLVGALVVPLVLVIAVLGSIVAGIASPTEASGIGAAGAMVLAKANGRLSWKELKDVCYATGRTVAFLYALIFGASCFSVVLRGYGGDEIIENALHFLSLGPNGTLILVLGIIFLLGFFLDWMEIVLIVAPLLMPILLQFGLDPIWVAVLIAICLQTSFLTPPVGMALFYICKAAPAEFSLADIYKGAIPFVLLQLFVLVLVACFPQLVTGLL